MRPEPWPVPCIWPGETVVVLAGGPSLTLAQVRYVALAHLAGKCRAIAVNDSVFVAWWADWCHGCDREWQRWHQMAMQQFTGIKTTVQAALPDDWGVNVKWLKKTGQWGFDVKPGCIRTGSNGAYQAIHCAVQAGAGRVILLGVDMREGAAGVTHWHGGHPVPRPSRYDEWVPHFSTLVEPLRERSVEVVNCSPGSAVTCWPMVRLEDTL